MKTSKLITSTRFFATLFFCAFFTSITVAQTITEPTILERTAKALKIAPNNPRVLLGNAEWNMGAAKFFGKSTQAYCKQIEKAIELGKAEKIEIEFYPKFIFGLTYFFTS